VLPRKTDVLVIGGGIAGCAVACFLAEAGADVVLIERHDLNTLASGSNAGSVHAQIPQHEFLTLGEEWAHGFASCIPLLLDSIALWRGLEAELETDLELSLAGGVMVARTDAQLRSVSRKAEIERRHGLHVEVLDRAELRALAPYVADDAVGGTYCPIEGKANPLAVAPAFARRATRFGAAIHRRTDLLGLTRDGDGFEAATSTGAIRARRVVNCAGADAARIAAMLGARIELQGFAIQVNVTFPTETIVPHLVYYAGGRLTLKQAHNGGFLIGGGWPACRDPHSGHPVVDPVSLRRNLHLAASVVPALADVSLLRTWPAVVNGTADWRPLLGELPGHAGLFMCCFPWIGFTAGPIAARVVADMVLGRRVSPALMAMTAQ
jgi:glycine/D-amino acid oxidase-like deaminating enzyme